MVRALVESRVLSQKGGGWIGEACLKRIYALIVRSTVSSGV